MIQEKLRLHAQLAHRRVGHAHGPARSVHIYSEYAPRSSLRKRPPVIAAGADPRSDVSLRVPARSRCFVVTQLLTSAGKTRHAWARGTRLSWRQSTVHQQITYIGRRPGQVSDRVLLHRGLCDLSDNTGLASKYGASSGNVAVQTRRPRALACRSLMSTCPTTRTAGQLAADVRAVWRQAARSTTSAATHTTAATPGPVGLSSRTTATKRVQTGSVVRSAGSAIPAAHPHNEKS